MQISCSLMKTNNYYNIIYYRKVVKLSYFKTKSNLFLCLACEARYARKKALCCLSFCPVGYAPSMLGINFARIYSTDSGGGNNNNINNNINNNSILSSEAGQVPEALDSFDKKINFSSSLVSFYSKIRKFDPNDNDFISIKNDRIIITFPYEKFVYKYFFIYKLKPLLHPNKDYYVLIKIRYEGEK